MNPVTRFAPSPSGPLHLGHAYSAALGERLARSRGGVFRLRIDDLDPARCRPEFVTGIYDDLQWLGLEFAQPVLVQSGRLADYRVVLDRLKSLGLIYACFCTRSDFAQALTAPHGDSATAYPGTCRDLPDDKKRRVSAPHCWRLNSSQAIAVAGLPTWSEIGGGTFTAARGEIGDAILARKDAPASYHLSCVVDDAASGVTIVVRGADLRASTPVQRLLQRVLQLPEPIYLHHKLVVHDDGRRLAKRNGAPTLARMRQCGVAGQGLVERLRMDELPSGFRLAGA